MNDKKITVIAQCGADGTSAIHPYLAAIDVPHGYEVELAEVPSSGNVAASYRRAMEASDAKYKVYLSAGSILLRLNFFEEMLRIFEADSSIGAMGLVGTKQLSTTGRIEQSPSIQGKLLYTDDTSLQGGDIEGDTAEVMVVRDELFATQVDLPWRSDIFQGDSFFVESRNASNFDARAIA